MICITGPDGAGKSTQVNNLIDYCMANKIDYRSLWMRRPYLFTFFVLFLAKILGLSIQENGDNGEKVGYHNFKNSHLISTIYPLVLLFDTTLFNFIKIKVPLRLSKKLIICDRYIYDIIVDIAISTGKESIPKDFVTSSLIKQIPRNSMTFIIIGDENLLKSRRPDILIDKTISKKIELYDEISNKYSSIRIDAGLSKENIWNAIIISVKE